LDTIKSSSYVATTLGRRRTINEVAERFNVESDVARGLINFFVAAGITHVVGKRTAARGRAENVYEFEDGYESIVDLFLRAGKLSED
jgi:hypothetical protein